MDIKTNLVSHRRALESNAQACATAISDMSEHTDDKDKLRQLEYMYRVLNDKYNELLQYTVRLEAATELAITSRHQYALEIARGDVESASPAALMSSVHRR